MGEDNQEERAENSPKNIYDSVLTFIKNRNGEKTVTVSIRYSKRGRQSKKIFPFPEGVNDSDLLWEGKYHGNRISVYHRSEYLKYINRENIRVPAELAHKLERLVLALHHKKS